MTMQGVRCCCETFGTNIILFHHASGDDPENDGDTKMFLTDDEVAVKKKTNIFDELFYTSFKDNKLLRNVSNKKYQSIEDDEYFDVLRDWDSSKIQRIDDWKNGIYEIVKKTQNDTEIQPLNNITDGVDYLPINFTIHAGPSSWEQMSKLKSKLFGLYIKVKIQIARRREQHKTETSDEKYQLMKMEVDQMKFTEPFGIYKWAKTESQLYGLPPSLQEKYSKMILSYEFRKRPSRITRDRLMNWMGRQQQRPCYNFGVRFNNRTVEKDVRVGQLVHFISPVGPLYVKSTSKSCVFPIHLYGRIAALEGDIVLFQDRPYKIPKGYCWILDHDRISNCLDSRENGAVPLVNLRRRITFSFRFWPPSFERQ
jgi:hypothetical protein